jgi:hypothetical protein
MKIQSLARPVGRIDLPLIEGEHPMIPFDLQTFDGLSQDFVPIARRMLQSLSPIKGTAFFTIHGKRLSSGQTHRRPGPHTDGNYFPNVSSWGNGGGNGWKVGENGPPVGSEEHEKSYVTVNGGILICSNFEACLGWVGEYEGMPAVGGDCSGLKLDTPFTLQRNTVYYGNNHFVHESLPMSQDVHRVLARITLPHDHQYQNAA